MSKSKIEWTEETWNPITGCTKCSEGCQNCYAEKFAQRLNMMGNKRYKNGFQVTIHEDLFEKPLSWKKNKLIFVNSMSDLFHEDISDDIILHLFSIMNKASNHTFQILTKRSQRLVELSHKITWSNNIWMGVSVENKDNIFRCNDLKKTDAYIKFVSAEPLLGSLNNINLNGIDWLIVGGESGPKSRHIEENWVVELQKLALDSETAFFFKQWGGFNKKKNGNLLNGEVFQSYPSKLKY